MFRGQRLEELKHYRLVNTLRDVVPGMAASSSLKFNWDAPEVLFGTLRRAGVAGQDARRGYAARDFWVAEDEGRLRAFYLVKKMH